MPSPATKRILTIAGLLVLALFAFYALVQLHAHAMLLLLNVLIILVLVPALLIACFIRLYALRGIIRATKIRMPLAALSAAAVLLAAYSLATGWLDQRLAERTYPGVYADCHKVWATRGLVLNRPADDSNAGNSVASVRRAFAAGARGAEIDLYFDTDLQRYVISHNRPYKRHSGELLFLEQLWREVGGTPYYWLDFKKLRHLSDADAANAVAKLQAVSAAAGTARDHIYVEGAAPFHLGLFRAAGFMTIFDIQPLEDDNVLTPLIVNLYKAIFYFGDYSVMALDYETDDGVVYGPRTRKLLGNIPLFVYHIPDDVALLRELAGLPQVRVLLDHDHGANHYRLTACTQN